MALQIRNAQISDLNGSKLTDSSVSLSKLSSSSMFIGSTSISLGNSTGSVSSISVDLVGDVTGQVSNISNHDTDGLSEGSNNLYYTNARFDTRLSEKDTDDLSEGSNLYYTDGRVDSHLSGGTGVTYNAGEISIGQAVATDSNVTFANLTLSGNLTVSGSTTTVNSNEVNIGDAIILLNSDETGTPSQNAGIEVERGTADNKSFIWDETNDTWSAGISDSIYAGGGFSGNLTGSVVASDQTVLVNATSKSLYLTGNDTDDLSEGSTNFYYTDARFDNRLSEKDTDDLSEGSNLYFTNARADGRIAAASIGDVSDVVLASTKEAGDMLLWDGSDYVNVKMVADPHTIGASPGDSITLNVSSDSDFYHMAQVYLNGQHMRFSSDTSLSASEDYCFSAANEITFSSGLIAEGDHVQVIVYVKQS